MRHVLFFLTLFFTSGCSTRSVNYDRYKILKKYSSNFDIFVDNEKTDLETLILDKDNIEKLQINKRTKEVNITQFNKPEYIETKNFNLDTLSATRKGATKEKVELVIIDGIPLTDDLKLKTRIDPNAIEYLTIISHEEMNKMTLCKAYEGDVLLIKTK